MFPCLTFATMLLLLTAQLFSMYISIITTCNWKVINVVSSAVYWLWKLSRLSAESLNSCKPTYLTGQWNLCKWFILIAMTCPEFRCWKFSVYLLSCTYEVEACLKNHVLGNSVQNYCSFMKMQIFKYNGQVVKILTLTD